MYISGAGDPDYSLQARIDRRLELGKDIPARYPVSSAEWAEIDEYLMGVPDIYFLSGYIPGEDLPVSLIC